jgi:hypothetical protein
VAGQALDIFETVEDADKLCKTLVNLANMAELHVRSPESRMPGLMLRLPCRHHGGAEHWGDGLSASLSAPCSETTKPHRHQQEFAEVTHKVLQRTVSPTVYLVPADIKVVAIYGEPSHHLKPADKCW